MPYKDHAEHMAYLYRWREKNPDKVAEYELRRRPKKLQYYKDWRKRNKERARELARSWAARNPEKRNACVRKYRRKRWATDPAFRLKKREKDLFKKYGVTLEKYDEMFNQQHGLCALCGEPPRDEALSVDHDHQTGRVRGLLCWGCNLALGRLERIDLEKVRKYLGG